MGWGGSSGFSGLGGSGCLGGLGGSGCSDGSCDRVVKWVEAVSVVPVVPVVPGTNAVTVNAAGTLTATAAVDVYTVALGNYSATINSFARGDKIVAPAGVTATLSNNSFTDGQASLQYASAGQVALITLTGLTNAQDASLFQATDFNSATVFGAGTV